MGIFLRDLHLTTLVKMATKIVVFIIISKFNYFLCPIVPDSRQSDRSVDSVPPDGQRCWGRHQFDSREQRCCTASEPCEEGEGDCDDNDECQGSLICGDNNCKSFGQFYHAKDDCCVIDPKDRIEPPLGQRCAGRNYPTNENPDGRRCCTPENPCDEGEGDCDGFGDGGGGDGNRGCKGNLVCGSNNCQKFGLFFHEKDDCCERPENIKNVTRKFRENPFLSPIPPEDQRCKGRNYDEVGRGCCTIAQPCGLGEGDCSSKDDGGTFNDNKDCLPGLVCGSNNCKKFGLWYHEKDDCCEEPVEVQRKNILCALYGTC